MNTLPKLIALSALVLLPFGCREKEDNKVLTSTVDFKKEGELQLLKAETDSVIASLDIEFADNEYETQTGLMYRQSMPDKQAMLFIFESEQPRSFYMKNTEFPLDIIFVNSNNRVVSIQKNAKPRDPSPLPSEAAALYVLEVNAGLSDKWQLEPGDKIQFTRQDE